MHPRNGKIAHLPSFIRNELNERLEGSEPGPQLLDWLNALPEVRKVVQERFGGVPISKQNLSEWRQGGFQEWLARRQLCEDARDLSLCAEEMEHQMDGELADAAATVMAARLGGLMAHWNGEADAAFEAKSRVLSRLCRSVVQLQRGAHQAIRASLEAQRIQDEREKAELEEKKRRLTDPIFELVQAGPLAKYFGGGTAGRKMAEFVLAIQNGRLDTEFDLKPTDTCAREAAAAVKPTATARPKRKRAAKPLRTRKVKKKPFAKSRPTQSGQVKPSQANLSPEEKDAGLGFGAESRLGESVSSVSSFPSLAEASETTAPGQKSSCNLPERG